MVCETLFKCIKSHTFMKQILLSNAYSLKQLANLMTSRYLKVLLLKLSITSAMPEGNVSRYNVQIVHLKIQTGRSFVMSAAAH